MTNHPKRMGSTVNKNHMNSPSPIQKPKKPMLTVITPTNKFKYMDNILQNFSRQNYPNKELIVILNDDSMDVELYRERFQQNENIFIFKLPESTSLGACKNYAIDQSHGDYIVFFDDDDYYGEHFLTKSFSTLITKHVDIVGKACSYFYFKNSGILALRFESMENKLVPWVNDSGMLAKKTVFDKVSYRDVTAGVDTLFFTDCKYLHLKIYSSDRYDYAVIRGDTSEHTWEIQEEWFNEPWFLERFRFVTKTDDFYPYLKGPSNRKQMYS